MPTLPLFQVDAFAGAVFAGNPASVVPLDIWLPDATMQAIAAENNQAETAFFVAEGPGRYLIRWFTPAVEVALCGHATLASGYVALTRLDPGRDSVVFRTLSSGELTVARQDELFTLDLPVLPAGPAEVTAELAAALGARPGSALGGGDLVAVFGSEAEVRGLRPDLPAVARLPFRCVMATAPGDRVDFVCRVFGPAIGIPEDPVTGSAFCLLMPYWAERLGRTELAARQVSARGGDVACRLAGGRVLLGGRAALYLEGRIHV